MQVQSQLDNEELVEVEVEVEVDNQEGVDRNRRNRIMLSPEDVEFLRNHRHIRVPASEWIVATGLGDVNGNVACDDN